jgi:hypothetical protein
MHVLRSSILALAAILVSGTTTLATKPKIDAETCKQLRLEEAKFHQSGILKDMSKGPAWAKANLSPERLREVEHYLTLDEQVKFGCRDAKRSPEAEKASEAATRLEINSDADPTAPPKAKSPKADAKPAVADPPKPAKAPTAAKSATKKRATQKKAPAASDVRSSDKTTQPEGADGPQGSLPTLSAQPAAAGPESEPSLPSFGFGEMEIILPPSR